MSQKHFVNTAARPALNCQAQSADHHHPPPRHLLTCCMCECVRVSDILFYPTQPVQNRM